MKYRIVDWLAENDWFRWVVAGAFLAWAASVNIFHVLTAGVVGMAIGMLTALGIARRIVESDVDED